MSCFAPAAADRGLVLAWHGETVPNEGGCRSAVQAAIGAAVMKGRHKGGRLRRIRVLIVDDSRAVRDGLRSILSPQADIEVVGEAVNGIDAVAVVEQLKPDVILMDAQMPVMDGIEATVHIKALLPDTRVLVLTVHTGFVDEALAAGADRYLMKDSGRQELLSAIRELGERR